MVWFTSDTHYWHARCIEYCNRPYGTVEEMNEDMVAKWNSVVKSEDTVYHLGDFSLAFRSVELYSNRLLGHRFLVPGNHDHLHSFHRRSRKPENQAKWIKMYEDYGWTVLPERTTVDLSGLGTVNLCHHPYSTEYELKNGDKYAKWRPVDDGKILLHGHIHEKGLIKKSNKGTISVNVGVDVWNFKPVSVVQLAELIKEQK